MGGLLTTLALPTGYPKEAGLVAFFDLMQDNLLLWPGDLAQAAWVKVAAGTGLTPTVTAGQSDPEGGTTVHLLQFSLAGGTTTSDRAEIQQQVAGLPNPHPVSMGCWMKSNDASTYVIKFHDNAYGLAVVSVTPTWQWFSYSQAAVSATNSTLTLGLRGAQGTSNTAGILIWRPQLHPSVALRDYQATTDLQTLSSLYGKSVTAQRGTTAGAEASDGSFGPNGWNGVTDDVIVSSVLADGTMAAPFDIPLVGLFNGTAGTIVSLAATGVTTHYQRVAYNGSGQIRIGTKAGAGAETFSADLAVSTADILALRFRSDGTTLTLTNHATGTSVTLASQSPTGACRLGIGCTAGSTVADIASAITATLGTLHGQQLSTAGWTRAYRSLKARAARKGVTVTP